MTLCRSFTSFSAPHAGRPDNSPCLLSIPRALHLARPGATAIFSPLSVHQRANARLLGAEVSHCIFVLGTRRIYECYRDESWGGGLILDTLVHGRVSHFSTASSFNASRSAVSPEACEELRSDALVLSVVKRLHLEMGISNAGIASTSRGLVGDTHFAILADLKPFHCFILTGSSQMVSVSILSYVRMTRPERISVMPTRYTCTDSIRSSSSRSGSGLLTDRFSSLSPLVASAASCSAGMFTKRR